MLHANVKAILTADHPVDIIRYLVSRDTESMTLTDVYKAGIETWAENLSDGVIAPLFYLVLFGLPGLAIYKAINTLDSMVAYKTEHYFYFGKAAARLDDLANLIPARLTALIIVALAKNKRRAWTCMFMDGNKLESPNAGYPIAAMAGALGVHLAGAASYHGQIKVKPSIGQSYNPVTKSKLAQALAMKPGIDFILLSLLAVGIYLSS
jgi:adenosylcobinamide-phosphate synthase